MRTGYIHRSSAPAHQRIAADFFFSPITTLDRWAKLAHTTPGYTDTAPQPSALTNWKYRAIYRVNDQQVGQWSNEMSITVGG